MLHEILLSLSGHPSPLLTASHTTPTSIFSPPEQALLASLAHLSILHRKLLTHTATIASSHPSSICQAVATAISSTHLAQFQRKIIEVEEGILRKDAGSVGAYSIVPLTQVVGEFAPWTRRMDWFLEVVEFMAKGAGGERKCSGAMIIDRLCNAMQTGYMDIEEAALSLVRVAETAWLKQVSAWVLYGRLPSFGKGDFLVQEIEGPEYEIKKELLPAFVTASTASSLLFIGRSLNHIRVKGASSTSSLELNLLASHLKQLSALTYPINSANFSRAIGSIRLSLSQNTLQKLLPLSKVVEILSLLREFFLLGRGEFAIALISEADEKIRSRWRRSDNLAYEKRESIGNIVVKDGEVSSVLARTWAAMGLLQGSQDDQEEDELLELARDLVQLTITKPTATPFKGQQTPSSKLASTISSTPFKNLLLSVPVSLTLQIPSPLDLFLSPSDLLTYSSINAYLLSIHRAHIRLTDLWKITSLRREHPAPPGPPYGSSKAGRAHVRILRERAKVRSEAMRSVWATCSAAVFFLGETQAYLQGEVVKGTWDGFKAWLLGATTGPESTKHGKEYNDESDDNCEEDIWLRTLPPSSPSSTFSSPANTTKQHTHDPQTLATAHSLYLTHLATSLLLTTPQNSSPNINFPQTLYTLLLQTDSLVALIHRINTIWTAIDLESDSGVIDAFSDFQVEEIDVLKLLGETSRGVKKGIEACVGVLRGLDAAGGAASGSGNNGDGDGFMNGGGDGSAYEELVLGEEGEYVPAKVGRVDRLLMKLDFGGWFDEPVGQENEREEGEDESESKDEE